MNIHEYQAKKLFADYEIPTQKGIVAFSSDGAYEYAKSSSNETFAIKAQIHAGGRGLGGGVKIAKNLEEVRQFSDEILGMTLITPQTNEHGQVVKKIYIEEGANIKHQYYLSIALDRSIENPIIIASKEGGVDIEEIALKYPEKIIKTELNSSIGLRAYNIKKICLGLGLDKEDSKTLASFLQKLYKFYIENDAELVEINPLIKTNEDKFIALDAKVSFDDNALYRHPSIEALRDIEEEEEVEIEANRHNLKYIELDGDIGCMVNGAGLAMAVMDIIKSEGGEPANFLDIGGGASEDTVTKAFEIMQKNRNIKVIFINIFGGIVRCDLVANGILGAIKAINMDIPLVVRLEGTNAKKGLQILKDANIKNIVAISDLNMATKKSIELAMEN